MKTRIALLAAAAVTAAGAATVGPEFVAWAAAGATAGTGLALARRRA